jgi:hypothetical protein
MFRLEVDMKVLATTVLRAVYVVWSIFISAVMASAQSYPEYDGVYLRMQDGSFVELPITRSDKGTRSVQFHLGGMHTNALGQQFFGYEDFDLLPIIDVREVEGIVVIGPQTNDISLFPLPEVEDAYKEYVDNPAATASYSHDGLTEEIYAADLPAIFTRQRRPCGWDAQTMRIKRIGEFVVEFSLKPEFRSENGGLDGRSFVKVADGSCMNTGKLTVIFEVANENYRASFRSKAGVDSFLTRTQKSVAVEPTWPPRGYFVSEGATCDGETPGGINFGNTSVDFHEHSCTLGEETVGDTLYLVKGVCTGEGQTYDDLLIFDLNPDGTVDYQDLRYRACVADTSASGTD